MATDAQITANRLNAQKSTGPKSPPGKCASRANSTKHGLSGDGVVVVDPARRAEAMARKARWDAQILPNNFTGVFAIERMVAMSLRIEDCENALEALIVEQTETARTDWEHSRVVEARATAEGLARRPERVAAQLEETKQGAELMLGRWACLLRSLELGAWDEADRASGLDLLGVVAAFRKPGQTPLDAPEGADAEAHVRRVIEAEVARLRGRIDAVLTPADERARGHVAASLTVLRSKPAALILRYEREATRRFHQAMEDAYERPRPGESKYYDPDLFLDPPAEPVIPTAVEPEAAIEPAPEPEPAPAAEPEPSADPGPVITPVAAPSEPPRRPNRRGRRAAAARLRRAG